MSTFVKINNATLPSFDKANDFVDSLIFFTPSLQYAAYMAYCNFANIFLGFINEE